MKFIMMSVEPIFAELTPYLKEILGYIATAAAGGVIGNRADAWFMSLFYHQRKRLIDWIDNWKPEIDDIKYLVEDKEIQMLFSNIIAEISNEINDKKFLLWPEITASIIRRKHLSIDKKQYFISLFKRLDTFSLQYLATLSVDKEIKYFNVFNELGEQPDVGSEKHNFYLGQLQCASTGLTLMKSDLKQTVFCLTQLGKDFIDFISDESNEKLRILTDK